MPSILSDADKETVKRTIPKASNKIQAVAVARLYVAYPDRSRWIYTRLQGAAVLSNDTVGNTFWIKLVDISVCTHRSRNMRYFDADAQGCSLLIGASYGTRKFMTLLPTTRTEPSSIPLSLRNAWPDCPLWTKKKPRNSNRKWTTGRRMPARRPGHSPLVRVLLLYRYHGPMERKVMADWVGLEVYYILTGTRRLPLSHRLSRSCRRRRTIMMVLHVAGAGQALTFPIPDGKAC
jgi:WH1 domain